MYKSRIIWKIQNAYDKNIYENKNPSKRRRESKENELRIENKRRYEYVYLILFTIVTIMYIVCGGAYVQKGHIVMIMCSQVCNLP